MSLVHRELTEAKAAKRICNFIDENSAACGWPKRRQNGFNLQRAVVISEDEYYAGYTIDQDDPEIVFVLPNMNRVRVHPAGHPLLETAKLLMATTPNGI
jgi:hypothetical protein